MVALARVACRVQSSASWPRLGSAVAAPAPDREGSDLTKHGLRAQSSAPLLPGKDILIGLQRKRYFSSCSYYGMTVKVMEDNL